MNRARGSRSRRPRSPFRSLGGTDAPVEEFHELREAYVLVPGTLPHLPHPGESEHRVDPRAPDGPGCSVYSITAMQVELLRAEIEVPPNGVGDPRPILPVEAVEREIDVRVAALAWQLSRDLVVSPRVFTECLKPELISN